MILKGYTYYNRKVGSYSLPQFDNFEKKDKVEIMQRTFIVTNDLNVKRELSESDLCYVGTFDDKAGKFEMLDKPEFLCNFSLGDTKDA